MACRSESFYPRASIPSEQSSLHVFCLLHQEESGLLPVGRRFARRPRIKLIPPESRGRDRQRPEAIRVKIRVLSRHVEAAKVSKGSPTSASPKFERGIPWWCRYTTSGIPCTLRASPDDCISCCSCTYTTISRRAFTCAPSRRNGPPRFSHTDATKETTFQLAETSSP